MSYRTLSQFLQQQSGNLTPELRKLLKQLQTLARY